MFEYYLEPSTKRTHQDFPPPMVILLPVFDADTLSALPEYLTSTIAARHDITGIQTGMGARPLIFDAAGVSLSERTMWALLVEQQGSSSWVTSYVDTSIEYAREVCWANSDYYSLAFCTGTDVVGQEPLYAYIDRWISREIGQIADIHENESKVIDAFERFLRSCDMDHETFQNAYIEKTIDYLYSNPDRQADFIVFRMLNGQYDPVQNHIVGCLRNRKGLLKMVVDRVLEEPEPAQSLAELVSILCAAVYGSKSELTSDVFSYCRQFREFDSEEIAPYFDRRIRRLQTETDQVVGHRSKKAIFSSGFHQYDPTAQSWLLLEL